MPTKKIIERFSCNICNRSFDDDYDSALNCENRGYGIPEFFDGTVVQLLPSRENRFGVVYQEYFEESDSIDRHRVPCTYEVLVVDKRPGHPSRMSVTMSRTFMRPFIFKDKKCPMCESKNVADHIEQLYTPFNSPIIPIKEVKMSKCSDCGVRFFLDYEKARKLILNEAGKWKIKINEDKEYY